MVVKPGEMEAILFVRKEAVQSEMLNQFRIDQSLECITEMK